MACTGWLCLHYPSLWWNGWVLNPSGQQYLFLHLIFFTTSGFQGELAHKIVKQLYGSTNKHHAEQQITKRYQRLERAHLALDRKQHHARTKQKSMDNKDDQVEGDSDLQYHIFPSKNRPVDIFDTISE